MGYYINPEEMSKEEWLELFGEPLDPTDRPCLPQCHAVCLVDNGGFTAAGVAYSEDERKAFARPDGRRKRWYEVQDHYLISVLPQLQGVLR